MGTFCFWVSIVIILVLYPTGFSLLSKNTSFNHLCRREERQSLLQLKRHLSISAPEYYDQTTSWNSRRDCCSLWDGVTCDDSTGHVIGLNLIHLYGTLDSNSSLLHLTHLRKLNLGFISFEEYQIPFKFGLLNSLTHLNLSGGWFGGPIPMEFYHLSNLVSLDLTGNGGKTPSITDADLRLLFGNMTKIRVLLLSHHTFTSELPLNMSSFLTHLDLGYDSIHGMLPMTIFEKPKLELLNLGGNYNLIGSLPQTLHWSNVQSIKTLDLAVTQISGRVPDSIGFMSNLKYMGLSGSKFSGPIPESIGNITGLTYMDWSNNEFSGHVPSTISSLRRLTSLDLSYNHLDGQLPDTFSGFESLTSLSFSSNHLAGQIPSSVTNMSELTELRIASNALTGHLPSRAGHGLQVLLLMDLSNNSIQGMIPSWLFNLPSLYELNLALNTLMGPIGKIDSDTLYKLDLSFNQLNISLYSFHNLTSISDLSISYNTVTEHERGIENVTAFPNLAALDMSTCEIKEFPSFLRSMPNLGSLDLSVNKIHGQIPTWFSSIKHGLSYLNLSTNFLTTVGYLPWQSLTYLDLHSNLLQGKFPSSICNMTSLIILSLSKNKLSGNIPEYIGNSSTVALEVLDLRSNEFNGKIPSTIGVAHYSLANLGLNDNHFEGPLPRSLANCTQLQVLDVGNNMIRDTFPLWLQGLALLQVLILKSNSFHGSIRSPASNNSFSFLQIIDLSYNNFSGILPEKLFARLKAMEQQPVDDALGSYANVHGSYEYSINLSVKGHNVEFNKVLRIFTTIDLSSNNFEGSIPKSFQHLILLRLLNLSHNSLSGNIPPELGHMARLEQLDLSNNHLKGGIPQTLTNLTFLAVLNLSYNHLVGQIPQGNQFSTFSTESYVGNMGLCGDPLTTSCGGKPQLPGVFDDDDEEDPGFMAGFTWKTVVIGYACGVVFGFILGNLMISTQKPKWLVRFVYTEAAIILKRRKKRAARMVLLGTR